MNTICYLASNPGGLAKDATTQVEQWIFSVLSAVEVKDVCGDLEDPNLHLTCGIL